MNRVLVAGATGYLGGYVLKTLKQKDYWVRALTRTENKIENLKKYSDDIFFGEITDPKTLKGITDEIDVVISSIGITRQKDNLTYMDVDYQANMNLLQQARQSGVSKFIYISLSFCDKTSFHPIVAETTLNMLRNH